MRGAMDGDVAAERQLNVIERLLARMPRDPTAPSTHLAAIRLLARPTHAYRPWAGNKHPRLGTRVPATPGLVSTQPIAR